MVKCTPSTARQHGFGGVDITDGRRVDHMVGALDSQKRAVTDPKRMGDAKAFLLVMPLFVLVRRARDSNPRGRSGYRPNGFQDRLHRPLGQPSSVRHPFCTGRAAPAVVLVIASDTARGPRGARRRCTARSGRAGAVRRAITPSE